ncbi:tryptophan aminotransferase-related protein 4-like [Abrus precatorius]|uniref:Tryptophan aminotransferase-related protein 4-like n=1 Tax=Abrus precatorius TaxID=3816 RepID=A0A8B8LRJ9_ABRPR|nr:tryptophan aminotransferase-related protein 4-like [Abrus precatorius]
MAKKTNPMLLAFVSIMILLSASNQFVCRGEWKPNWSTKAAEEAEAVAAITCSGHGRAYIDGLILNGHEPVCECNSCYGGSDCSNFLSNCSANAESGDPLFLEPFWMQHAASSAILVSGWHRMKYIYSDGSLMSEMLVKHIRKVHDIVGNAVTEGRYIIFGNGATHLLNAAVYALSLNSSISPAKVVATTPHYDVYRSQTQLFNSRNYIYEGDTSSWKNYSDSTTRFIEFVTSPNNPDGKLNKGILHGPNVKTIYDRVYYWPHFTAIPSPADEDLMVFSISKLTGHAGSRFGWAIVKDEAVYQNMLTYVRFNTIGVSHDAQLRALKLLDMAIEGDGKEIFQFSYPIMRDRWIRLKQVISKSRRYSLQKLSARYCNFFKMVRDPSPAYAWLKCKRQSEKNCYEILKTAGIIGRQGSRFNANNRYIRLSLIRSQDDYEMLINKFRNLVAKETETKIKFDKWSKNITTSSYI